MGLLQFSDPASNLFKSIRALFQAAEEATVIDIRCESFAIYVFKIEKSLLPREHSGHDCRRKQA
jgi:hypothetical protein